MRYATKALLVAVTLCFAGEAIAQVNMAQAGYDLFPGFGEIKGHPMKVSYRAWVISYKDNAYYECVAGYDFGSPETPTLTCDRGGSFNPPLLKGATVKTVQAPGGPRGGPGTDEAQSSFFWQIDQVTGKIQFCMPTLRTNCVAFQIQ